MMSPAACATRRVNCQVRMKGSYAGVHPVQRCKIVQEDFAEPEAPWK